MMLDDPSRLSAFRDGRIETTNDPVLTALVKRVAAEADVPIALVSLVMDRVQYFRAAVGLPTELALASATNRCDSFCQFVVQEEKLFVVEDAPNDGRVPQALVERYGIMAYAGAPLRVEGHVLGSICVIDVKPRKFSPAFLDSLVAAAAAASQRLEQLASGEANLLAPSEIELGPRELLAQVLVRLTNLFAAARLGTPLMNKLAQLPREAWSVEVLGQQAERLGEAATFYRAMSDHFHRLQAFVYQLARTSLSPTDGAIVPALVDSIRVLGRILAEGLTFVRVVEALADDALTVADTSRVLSVLHMALGFSNDLRASLAIALTEARRIDVGAAAIGGAS